VLTSSTERNSISSNHFLPASQPWKWSLKRVAMKPTAGSWRRSMNEPVPAPLRLSQPSPWSPSLTLRWTSFALTTWISGTVDRKIADGSLSLKTTVCGSGAWVVPGRIEPRKRPAGPFFIASMRSIV